MYEGKCDSDKVFEYARQFRATCAKRQKSYRADETLETFSAGNNFVIGEFCRRKIFLKGVFEMSDKEIFARRSGTYRPTSKVEVFCVSECDNAVFEVKIAEKIRQMSEYDYDLQDLKFSVSANVFPSVEETQEQNYDFEVELSQTKSALLIFRRAD